MELIMGAVAGFILGSACMWVWMRFRAKAAAVVAAAETAAKQ